MPTGRLWAIQKNGVWARYALMLQVSFDILPIILTGLTQLLLIIGKGER